MKHYSLSGLGLFQSLNASSLKETGVEAVSFLAGAWAGKKVTEMLAGPVSSLPVVGAYADYILPALPIIAGIVLGAAAEDRFGRGGLAGNAISGARLGMVTVGFATYTKKVLGLSSFTADAAAQVPLAGLGESVFPFFPGNFSQAAYLPGVNGAPYVARSINGAPVSVQVAGAPTTVQPLAGFGGLGSVAPVSPMNPLGPTAAALA